ncbi:hypothetical protein BV898_01218 [Hypsibius exemplaris]|uniref:Uncharacterized protein n=1 Tax=Hypsibius exemplaris TaxID=2072580 RepID=A0A1W0XC48_HYPEX|nr:hypothetical protein BV898_01218 [Hypsibius exemplaris]
MTSTTVKCQHAVVFTTLGLVLLIVALCAFLAPMGGPEDYIRPVTRVVIPSAHTTRVPWMNRTTTSTRTKTTKITTKAVKTTSGWSSKTTTANIQNDKDNVNYNAVATLGAGAQALPIAAMRGKRGDDAKQQYQGTIKMGHATGDNGTQGMQMHGQVAGLTPGQQYGVTMHQYGDMRRGCGNLGPGMALGVASRRRNMNSTSNDNDNKNSGSDSADSSRGNNRNDKNNGNDNDNRNNRNDRNNMNDNDSKNNRNDRNNMNDNDSKNSRNDRNNVNDNDSKSNRNNMKDSSSMDSKDGKSKSSDRSSSNSNSNGNSNNMHDNQRGNWNNDNNDDNDRSTKKNSDNRNSNSNDNSRNGNNNNGNWDNSREGGNNGNMDRQNNDMGRSNMGSNGRQKREADVAVNDLETYVKMNPVMADDDDNWIAENDYEDYNGTLVGVFTANETGCGEFVYFVVTGVVDECGGGGWVYGRSVAIRPIYGAYEDSDETTASAPASEGSVRQKRQGGKNNDQQKSSGEQQRKTGENGEQQKKTGDSEDTKMRGMKRGMTSRSEMREFGLPGMQVGMPVSCGVFARMR